VDFCFRRAEETRSYLYGACAEHKCCGEPARIGDTTCRNDRNAHGTGNGG
jgi:hypothetical protein